jgi:hypothetical protein
MARTTPGNYVPLDVNYSSDPAIRAAGEHAELLFVRGIAYCKRTRTDGFIPDFDLPVVAIGLRSVPKRVAALVSHGLWRPVDGGWVVRSWSRWNKPAAVEAAFVSTQAEHGTKGNHERWHAARGIVDPDCEHCANPNRVPDPEPDGLPDRAPESPIREGKGSTKAKALGRKRPAPDPDHPEDPTAQTVVAGWIDRQRRRPAGQVVGQVAKQVKTLLAEDFTAEQIANGLAAMDAKGLNPSTLPSLVTSVANGNGIVRQLPGAQRPGYVSHRADGQIPHWDL